MRTLRRFAITLVALVALASACLGYLMSDGEITDMDVEAFMRGHAWIKWTEGKESASRSELYPALYRWKHDLNLRSAQYFKLMSLILFAAVLMIWISSRGNAKPSDR